MVSLGEDGRRTGGYFFDQSVDHALAHNENDDDALIETSQLGTDDDPGFRQVPTPFSIILLIILVFALALCIFVLPAVCSSNECHVPTLSILLYTHGTLWFLVMLGDRYLRIQYNAIRTCGYLEFYRKTRCIRRVPFAVFSGGNAFLLILMTILHDHCNEEGPCAGVKLTQINYFQIICSVEVLIVMPVLIVLLVKTLQFNRSQVGPDVIQDDMMHTYLQSHAHSMDIGFRDDDFVDDVLEKQADLIRYLKQHNATLGKKVLQLTAELQHQRG